MTLSKQDTKFITFYIFDDEPDKVLREDTLEVITRRQANAIADEYMKQNYCGRIVTWIEVKSYASDYKTPTTPIEAQKMQTEKIIRRLLARSGNGISKVKPPNLRKVGADEELATKTAKVTGGNHSKTAPVYVVDRCELKTGSRQEPVSQLATEVSDRRELTRQGRNFTKSSTCRGLDPKPGDMGRKPRNNAVNSFEHVEPEKVELPTGTPLSTTSKI